MFRMAALFVVERLKPWLMTYLAALLATAAPAPLIRQASGRYAQDVACPVLGPVDGSMTASYTGTWCRTSTSLNEFP